MLALRFVNLVRRRLDHPLPQKPSPRLVLDHGFAAYRHLTTRANNTGNAWAMDEIVLNTTADTRRYDLTTIAPRFSKALLVSTVPAANSGEPELTLDFTQIEQIPRDWAWLQDSGFEFSLWDGLVAQKARLIAFYRQIAAGATGFKNWLEIRPTPAADEQYRIVYQVGDWQRLADATNLSTFIFPFPELDYYFIAVAAYTLLPHTEWSQDEERDAKKRNMIEAVLKNEIASYQPTVDAFIANLAHTDIVWADSYADSLGL
jgi:hypothetical protein